MWTYQQTGHLITPGGQPSEHRWYSGYGDHANKPQDEGMAGMGPLPRGTYRLSKLIAHPTSLGPVAIHLIPDAPTYNRIIQLGRSPMSFFIHDGDVAHDMLASEGCLVCMDGTVGVMSMWNSSYKDLTVVSGAVGMVT